MKLGIFLKNADARKPNIISLKEKKKMWFIKQFFLFSFFSFRDVFEQALIIG